MDNMNDAGKKTRKENILWITCEHLEQPRVQQQQKKMFFGLTIETIWYVFNQIKFIQLKNVVTQQLIGDVSSNLRLDSRNR